MFGTKVDKVSLRIPGICTVGVGNPKVPPSCSFWQSGHHNNKLLLIKYNNLIKLALSSVFTSPWLNMEIFKIINTRKNTQHNH